MKRCNKKNKRHADPICIDSRPMAGYRRRRYRCGKCDARWSTIEIAIDYPRGGHLTALELLRESLGVNLEQRQLDAIHALVMAFTSGEGEE